jgi:hypothetical protein
LIFNDKNGKIYTFVSLPFLGKKKFWEESNYCILVPKLYSMNIYMYNNQGEKFCGFKNKSI